MMEYYYKNKFGGNIIYIIIYIIRSLIYILIYDLKEGELIK